MDIVIEGSFLVKFWPELKDNMTNKELVDERIWGYLTDELCDGNFSFTDDIFNDLEAQDIIKRFGISLESDSPGNASEFESFCWEFIETEYVNLYQSREELFKSLTFMEPYEDYEGVEIKFYATLFDDLESLCSRFIASKQK